MREEWHLSSMEQKKKQVGRSIRNSAVKATAPSRVIMFCCHLRVIRRIGQGVFPSGKMLLESFGLHQCQGSCVQPFQSKSRVHLEGASATVQQVAKHPNICRHRWNPYPKRARNSRKILCEYFRYTKRASQIQKEPFRATCMRVLLAGLCDHRVFFKPFILARRTGLFGCRNAHGSSRIGLSCHHGLNTH